MSDIKPLPEWEFSKNVKPIETTEAPVETTEVVVEADRPPSLWSLVRSAFLGDEKKSAAPEAPYRPNAIEKLFCKDMGIRMTCSEESLKEDGLAFAQGIENLFDLSSTVIKNVDAAWRLELGSVNYWYEHTKAVWTGTPSPYVRPPAAAPGPSSALTSP